MTAAFAVVVPTTGRPELRRLLDRLAEEGVAEEVIVVTDEEHRGPAHVRNQGWRRTRADWVVFLDDDVVPAPGWRTRLLADLDQPAEVAAVSGRIRVPAGERTDWRVSTAGLERAAWITADIAYRRSALEAVQGFDENFPRAYREDADLAYRVRDAGGRLVRGTRVTEHPVRAESRWVSLRSQRGNADDAYLRRRYGARWHERLEVPRGRRRRHALSTGLLLTSVAFALARKPAAATVAAAGWLATTAEFTTRRLLDAPAERRRPGPLLATSALIPPLAVGHWLRGWWEHRDARPYQKSPIAPVGEVSNP